MNIVPIKKYSLYTLVLALFTCTPAFAVNYTVNTTNDVYDGTCDSSHCSLREAIVKVNKPTCTGDDEIHFNIPVSNASSGSINYYSIQVTSPLPIISCPVKIDGYTQPGSSAGSPRVEVTGELLGGTVASSSMTSSGYPAGLLFVGRDKTTGAKLSNDPSGSTVQGLMINRFPRHGIYAYGADKLTIVGNFIGLDVTGQKATYSNTRIFTTGSDDVRTEGSDGNYIGTTEADYDSNSINNDNRNYFGSCGGSCVAHTFFNENINGFNQCAPATCGKPAIGSSHNVVQGNYIGLNKDGNRTIGGYRANGTPGDPAVDPTASYSINVYALFTCFATPTGHMQDVTCASNTWGGKKAGMGNVIAGVGNPLMGIQVSGPKTKVIGNIFGLDATGTSSANIQPFANSQTVIGVINAGWGSEMIDNIIAQGRIGIVVAAFRPLSAPLPFPVGPYNVTIKNNIIGTDKTKTLNVGHTNAGIFVAGTQGRFDANKNLLPGSNNLIEDNVITNNQIGILMRTQATGPFIAHPSGVSVLSNAIYKNNGLGLDWSPVFYTILVSPPVGDGPTLNDSGDGDVGPNDLQNFPVLEVSNSFINPEKAKVQGSLDSKPNKEYLIQVFANDVGDPSTYGEGRVFIGEKVVTTDSNGHVDFTFMADKHSPAVKDPNTGVCSPAPILTATATDKETGDTSEFSQWVEVDVNGSANAYKKRCD